MAQIIKPKIEIKKKTYYVFLLLISIYMLIFTIYFLSAMVVNTDIYDDITNKSKRDDKIVTWMTGKVISYISNSLLIMGFLAYISLGRHRTTLGYVWLVLWIALFVAIGVSPHILDGSHDEPIRMVCGILATIVASVIVIALLYLGYELNIQRRIKRRELYKVFKSKN